MRRMASTTGSRFFTSIDGACSWSFVRNHCFAAGLLIPGIGSACGRVRRFAVGRPGASRLPSIRGIDNSLAELLDRRGEALARQHAFDPGQLGRFLARRQDRAFGALHALVTRER